MITDAAPSNFVSSPIKGSLFRVVMAALIVVIARFLGEGPPRPHFNLGAGLFLVLWALLGFRETAGPQPIGVRSAAEASLAAIQDGLILGVSFGAIFYLGSQRSIWAYISVYLGVATGVTQYRRSRGQPDTGYRMWIAPGIAFVVSLTVGLIARVVLGFSITGRP